MANLDELQIKISATSKEAEEAINSLVKSLENLNDVIGRLDARKISSFASAMGKLSNIGAGTSTTAKAIKEMSRELSSSFGIRTKKGVEDITVSLQALYNASRNVKLNDSEANTNVFNNSIKNLQDAIEAHYKYKVAVDHTTKSIAEYVRQQNASGRKVAMGEMAAEYGEDFKRLSSVLGKSFKNSLKSTEGAQDLAEFFRDMNDTLHTDFKTGDMQELGESVERLVIILENAKDKTYDFGDAVREGLLSGEEAANAAYSIVDRIFALIKEQDKYGASSGLGSIVEVFKQISNIQMPDFSGVADAIKAAQGTASEVGSAAPNVEKVSSSMDDVSSSAQDATANTQDLSNALMNIAHDSGIDVVAEQMRDFASHILEAAKVAGLLENKQKMIEDKYYNPIDTSGEWVENNPPDNEWVISQGKAFEEAAEQAEKAGEAVAEAQDKMKSGHASADVLENIVALGEAFEKLSRKLDAIGDKFIKFFNLMTTPLKAAANEYVEKFEHLGDIVKGFQQKFKAHMAKVAAFWKRTMKTFTFMLVRKAITAIIKEVGNAVQSLAMYSNAMDTAFNTDISNMVADFQYLGRSIVSVFAPLINIVAPIIDAIVAKIATLLSYIGMLIAALGGSSSFTKAKKNVGNYAESLDKASKSAKNLTMGIDELNILSDSSGGSSKPYDGWEDAWEEVEIPKWILDLGDKLKKMWDDFVRPLKEAWDRVKEYFKFAFKYMTEQVKLLAKSIWDAFIEVWNEEATIEMFANILRIVADLMIVVGNLAKNFREAWDEAGRGVRIFEGIRDIFAVLIEHVRNVTWYMVRWSSELDFGPLLDSIIGLLGSLTELADFLGGVFEDVMKNVVLKYIKWLIEEGIPHLNHTISEIIDSFDFEKIRQDLVPFEEAFERLLEHLEEGTTNALGNLGRQVAEFANSQAFTDFMQRLADIMDLLSAEDVEKILTGLGEGILSIAEGVVNFVNSDTFMGFLEAIDQWLENASSEDIAGILEGIAIAIGMFKFGAFVGEGLAGFFQFASVLVALKNLHEIAAGLKAAAGGATAAAGGFSAFASAALPIVGIVVAIIAAAYSLVSSFGGLTGLMDRLKESADRVANTFKTVASALKLDEHIAKLKEKIQGLLEKLGTMADFWNVIITIFEIVAHIIAVILAPAIDIIITAFTAVIDIISGVIDIFAGLGSVIAGFVEGIATGDWSKMTEGFNRIGEGLVEGLVSPFADVADGIGGAISGAIGKIGSWLTEDVGAEIKTADWEKIPEDQQVGQRITNGINNSYKNASSSAESTMKETTKTFLNNGLSSAAGEADYTTPAVTYNQKLMEELYSGANAADWAQYGTLINTKTGEEILNQSQPFDEANLTAATEGAEEFSGAYSDYFASNSEIASSLETFGQESGLKLSTGFNESISQGQDSTTSALLVWFGNVKGTINRQLDQIKALFSNKFSSIFTEIDLTRAIDTVFANLTSSITTNINTLGAELIGNILPTFMQTYILPFFNLEMWQPLFENLLNMVFIPFFEQFRVWFAEEAMTPWWEEDLLSWFADDKWNEDIFNPLQENIQGHWDTFSSWWDTTMTEWWENQVKPWFKQDIWEEQFRKILEVAKKVFDLIQEAITERINQAKDAVIEACGEMSSALGEVLALIGEVMGAINSFGSLGGNVTFNYSGEFAAGGFPAQGSLFLAGEAGAEFVTNVGGKTGVVSNGEITGIEDAVYVTGNAETELLSQLITIGRAMLDKDPVVIGDKDIARMANKGQSKLGMSIIS